MSWWPFMGRRERLRREASDWVAKLNGPDRRQHAAAFDQWYRADPAHAAAYDRLAMLFETAGQLRPQRAATPVAPQPRHPYAFSAAVAGACFAVVVLVAVFGSQLVSSRSIDIQSDVFVVDAGESRVIRLADGSEVLLASGSALRVDIDADGRRLELMRGEGQFKVFHEGRRFVVAARGAEIVATGTRFVVRLGERDTLVSLIEGRVEVSYPTTPGGGIRRTTVLAPGQRLMVPDQAKPTNKARGEPTAATGHAMIDFDDVALSEAVDRVNGRGGEQRLRLADPALAGLRVTGAFRPDDVDGFARSVAAALGLRLERAADGTLWLHPAGAVPRRL